MVEASFAALASEEKLTIASIMVRLGWRSDGPFFSDNPMKEKPIPPPVSKRPSPPAQSLPLEPPDSMLLEPLREDGSPEPADDVNASTDHLPEPAEPFVWFDRTTKSMAVVILFVIASLCVWPLPYLPGLMLGCSLLALAYSFRMVSFSLGIFGR